MKKELLSIVFGLFCLLVHAQSITIKGAVKSTTGESIIGANIVLLGTYDGASSDLDGQFSFSTEEKGKQILQITYIGFDTLSMPLELKGQNLEFNLKLKETVNELNAVTIVAGVFEASDTKKSVILKSVDIALTAGAVADITGAMLTLPGTVRNQESGQLLVRGGAAYETRTLIDGLYVQNAYNSTTGNLPARNRFSPFMFKGMMFSSGGYSAEYGQALSSALILNSSDVATQNTTGIQLLSVGGGLSQQKSWAKSSLSVSSTYSNLSPYFKLIKQNFDWKQAPESGNVELSFKTKTSSTGIFKFYASGLSNGFNMNVAVDGDEKQKMPLKLSGENLYLNTSYRDVVFKDWTLFVGSAYTWNRDKIRQNFQLNTLQQSAQSRFTLTKSLSEAVKLKFGAEHIWSVFDENYTEGETFKTLHNDNYLAAFAETDLKFSEKWLARVGVRAEQSSLLGRGNVAPRLSTAYILGKGEQLAFSFGQFYQTPEHTQMRRSTAVGFEQADHYILTYQKQVEGYIFRVEGYYKNYHNLLKTTAELPQNTGYGYARGIDLFWRDSKSIKNGDYYVSYSFLDTERNYRDFPEQAMPYFAAKHNVAVVYKHWIHGLNTMLSTTYAFQSGRPYNDPNSSVFNGSRTPVFQDLSLTLSYITNIKDNFTVVYIAANNVPGFRQVSGYRFASTPDEQGRFAGSPILPPAKRFIFLGLIMTIGEKFVKNQGNNDDL